ncbi:unnamed protein product [Nippostrongylus brasiliensis]|uniref:Uncharacterized protein n=1 Tax=Nippostrongylus brasiliensis TaxID=27835 RepID=A0A158QX98_NIPBR|nr:unnamed protein product [Nippostrongylus brasiliensis]
MSTRAAMCAASLEEHIQRLNSSNQSSQVTSSTMTPSASQEGTKAVVGPRTSGGQAVSSPTSTAHDRLPSDESKQQTSQPSSPAQDSKSLTDEPSTVANEQISPPDSLELNSSTQQTRKPVPNGNGMFSPHPPTCEDRFSLVIPEWV